MHEANLITINSNTSLGSTRSAAQSKLARVDNEHTRITAMLDKATQAFVRQASPSEVNAILLELSGYTLTHFREEEALMLSCDYPGFVAHKAEHDRLATYVRGLLDMRSKQEALRCAVGALDLWLDAHIRITDKEFSNFVGRVAIQD